MTHSFGRIVNHDPRSLAFKVRADGTAKTARWARRIPILDQGDLGSCTGNAATGALGTAPFYGTAAVTLDESYAVGIYSDAEKVDGGAGYPPEDEGSSGLSVAKVCLARGLISGYTHITSVAAAQTAIQSGPFIVGSVFTSSMEKPDSHGIVRATGTVLGGHEYECMGYDATTDLWEFCNSWGTGWGVQGRFFYTSGTFAQLLAQDGDATVFVPVTQPAPVPTPAPSSGTSRTFAQSDLDYLNAWSAKSFVRGFVSAGAKAAWKRGT